MLFLMPVKVEDNGKRQTVPIANSVIIAVNVLLYWMSDWMATGPESGLSSVITYGFAHSGLMHLLGNMWVLWVFGNPVNRRLGNGWYVLAYFGTILMIGIVARVLCGVPVVGASGAIFAVIAICLLLIPASRIRVAFIAVFPITLLVGLIARPKEWIYWIIRWDVFRLKATWGLLIVPALQLWGLFWWGWNWTNVGHLLGLVCGVAVVLLLPERISMNRRAALST